LLVVKVKGSCNNLSGFCGQVLLQPASLAQHGATQQSVQPTGGIRPDLQAFFWLRAFSALEANPRPPTSG
jgi:hypothetical protein